MNFPSVKQRIAFDKSRVLRINETTAPHLLPKSSGVVTESHKRQYGSYQPRERAANEAIGCQLDWRELDDYDGKELREFEGRPGSMEAFYLPSIQDGKRVYPKRCGDEVPQL